MLNLLQKLSMLDGVSGNEASIADFIISEIDGFCEYRRDNLGNIIAFKKGRNKAAEKLLVDAHMDEVGLIITHITEDGFLKFQTVGGINTEVLLARQVRINGTLPGVISTKPVHLLNGDAKTKLPEIENLYIDIGLSDKASAEKVVSIGDRVVIMNDFILSKNKVLSKALDDRIGCAILISLLKESSDYDFYASFTIGEEVGLRGIKTAAFSVTPDAAIVLESTTAADILGIGTENQVCNLGGGAAVSFMDNATVYDRAYYNAALNSGIKTQPKRAVAGGNNSGALHLTKEGVRTLAISVPCRYIHSASCVAHLDDITSAKALSRFMINGICSGSIK